MTRFFLLAIAAFTCAFASFGQYNLIPQPQKLTTKAETRVTPQKTERTALKGNYPNDEAYTIDITPNAIEISANTPQAFLWAERTLEQLVDTDGSYPQVTIEDWPEFPIRGFMYDTGRNFIEVDQVKEFIDLSSKYKLNVFHWHLTDHPAWRIESKVYPQLNDGKYQRIGRDQGRYYTWQDIHDVANYAKEKGVLIIPELDMPGHSEYFKTTFGTTMNTPEGMAILDKVLDEFFAEFPAEEFPYIHIGSDEIRIQNPEEFMDWAIKKVEDAGRIPMVWDPGLEAGPNAIYQVWREGVANQENVGQGKKIVDSYQGYLNYVDPMMHNNEIFLHKACATGKSSDSELGGILCLWNDVRVIDKSRIPYHNNMMGGMLPFAERMWVGGGSEKPFKYVMWEPSDPDMQKLMEFQDRVAVHKEKYLPELLSYWVPNSPQTQWNVELADSAGVVLYQGTAYGDVVDFDALARELNIPNAEWATITRTIYADKDTVMNCRIGFEAAPRSDRISDGIPQQGKWENFGEVTINGENVIPAPWNQPGSFQFHHHTWSRPQEEIPYTDEQFYWMRQPTQIQLHQGDNVITLKTRKHFRDQRFQAALLDIPVAVVSDLQN